MSANGRLRDSELTYVQGQIRLANVTATAWDNFVGAALAAGNPPPTITPPYGGYRSYSDQVKAHGKGNHQYSPGTSVHGHGTCVDIWNWARIDDIDTLAGKYGFRRTIDGEPWHYQHDGRTTAPAGTAPTPITPPQPQEDDDMNQIRIMQTPQAANKKASDWWVVNFVEHKYWHIQTIAQRDWLRNIGIQEIGGQQPFAMLAGFTRI